MADPRDFVDFVVCLLVCLCVLQLYLTIGCRMRVDGLRAEIEKLWWQPLLKILHDTFSITPKASLPTKEKEALKKAFGGFNTGFEQVLQGKCDDDQCDDLQRRVDNRK
jgi:hypothetical protein